MSETLELALTDREIARFWGYLRREEATGCLLWVGYRTRCGGRFRVGRVADGTRRLVYAHRVAFLLGGGVLTTEKPFVLHNCPHGDNSACSEFSHLFAGTLADNMADMARKNRGLRGRAGLPFGVSHGKAGRFRARIKINRRMIGLGVYATAEEANAVALEAKALRRGGLVGASA